MTLFPPFMKKPPRHLVLKYWLLSLDLATLMPSQCIPTNVDLRYPELRLFSLVVMPLNSYDWTFLNISNSVENSSDLYLKETYFISVRLCDTGQNLPDLKSELEKFTTKIINCQNPSLQFPFRAFYLDAYLYLFKGNFIKVTIIKCLLIQIGGQNWSVEMVSSELRAYGADTHAWCRV